MVCIPALRSRDQPAVSPLLIAGPLVDCGQNDRSPFRIKGEDETPEAAGRETELLQVVVARSFERIDQRPAELRSKLLQYEQNFGKIGCGFARKILSSASNSGWNRTCHMPAV